MIVIVRLFAAFGLTVLAAKTEIACLHRREVLHGAATGSVEAAGQANAQFCIPRESRQPSYETPFRKYTLKLHDRPSPSLERKIQIPMLEFSRQCCTIDSHGVHALATTALRGESITAS